MYTIEEISKIINGNIVGDRKIIIKGVCDVEIGKHGYITYLKNEKYKKYLLNNQASVVVVDNNFDNSNLDKTIIKVKNPSLSFIKLLSFFKSKKINKKTGIDKNSHISNDAIVGNNVYIGSHVIIEKNACIADDVNIFPGSYIGENTIIGKETVIHPNVTIYDNVTIGKRCKINAGTVVGSDGFGIVTQKGKNFDIPHIGSVLIEDDVSIGSNCSIDRGTFNNTVIGKNTKLDNLIQIGHNVNIGKGCMLSAQVGIAGSSIIGNNVVIAGQSGIIDHISIGDNSVIAVKSCVYKTIPKNSFVSGIPAKEHKIRLKEEAIIKKLPTLYKEIKKNN